MFGKLVSDIQAVSGSAALRRMSSTVAQRSNRSVMGMRAFSACNSVRRACSVATAAAASTCFRSRAAWLRSSGLLPLLTLVRDSSRFSRMALRLLSLER